MQIELAKVIEQYFGADAAYLDIDCFTLARRIMEAGWTNPVRCKDCKSWKCLREDRGLCKHPTFTLDDDTIDPLTEPDDFCSYGK